MTLFCPRPPCLGKFYSTSAPSSPSPSPHPRMLLLPFAACQHRHAPTFQRVPVCSGVPGARHEERLDAALCVCQARVHAAGSALRMARVRVLLVQRPPPTLAAHRRLQRLPPSVPQPAGLQTWPGRTCPASGCLSACLSIRFAHGPNSAPRACASR